jgi:hypothetical protein
MTSVLVPVVAVAVKKEPGTEEPVQTFYNGPRIVPPRIALPSVDQQINDIVHPHDETPRDERERFMQVVKEEPQQEPLERPRSVSVTTTDWASSVTGSLKQRIPNPAFTHAPVTPQRGPTRWSVGKFSGAPAGSSGDAAAGVPGDTVSDPRSLEQHLAAPVLEFIQSTTLPADPSLSYQEMPLPFGDAAQMQARAAQLALDQEVTRGRIEQMKQMLTDYTEDDLQIYDQEEGAIAFNGLLLELEATFFELASRSETISRYLGERKAQEKGMLEIATDKRVPVCVRQYLLFLCCREIQRARNYLYAQGQSGPSVKEWKRKLRDNLRRRIHSYLQLDKSYRTEKTAEECAILPERPARCKREKKKL